MTKLARLLKDHRESGAMNALVGLHAAVDDHTFLTKGGDLVVFLGLQGADYECLDASQLDQTARRFETALKTFDDNFRIYQYLLKRSRPPIPHRIYADPVVQRALAGRVAYLDEKADKLYSVDVVFAIVYEGWANHNLLQQGLGPFLKKPLTRLRQIFSTAQVIEVLQRELDRASSLLNDKVVAFTTQLSELVEFKLLDKGDAYHVLRRLLNYAPHKTDTVKLKYDRFVDYQACDSTLECHGDHLRLDDYYVSVLTLKEPPRQTFAHMLRGLQEIPGQYILANEWKPRSDIRSVIQTKRRHFHNSKVSLLNYFPGRGETASKDMLVDDSAAAIERELGACLEDVGVQAHRGGEFSLTVIPHDQDRMQLKRTVAQFFKVFAAHDAQLTEETYNSLNAFAGILPGNRHYNLRKLWLLDNNYADCSLLFTIRTGEQRNVHLNDEYLAVFESNNGTPYFFNFHYLDRAHALALGSTGSGKSFTVDFLITHAQKYGPRTYVFDLGGSYRNVTRLFQGAYLQVGLESRSFTINPFTLPPTKENKQFLFSFVKVLLGSYDMNAQEEREVFEQIENLYVIEPDQRRLLTLSNMLNRRLRGALQKWMQGGQYGAWFDNGEDNLTFAKFQTFDFAGMDKIPDVLEPLFFYLLHRASATIYDTDLRSTFKVFVVDEAWRFLRHPAIRLYITEALKTWRKWNAMMLLATQSSEDLVRSEMLSVVVESTATKMFLANPDIDRALYRDIFHLNDTEADWITRLLPKQQMLIKRPDFSKIVNLKVSPEEARLYASQPFDFLTNHDPNSPALSGLPRSLPS